MYFFNFLTNSNIHQTYLVNSQRMFPSMRLSVSGLEEETNYCVLLEMVPIGDCRYKFSGSQWVPAGGAEPQSPQRMYLHPDSPATGAHWQAQPILFNKVKLTNNTLDNSGHIVLASMHKYQPRLHVIRTADLAQIPWAPQQAFVFAETEFVAVTAYQNDRITKLKIDNNPFAKGFRETGQSRCKRKMSSSPTQEDQDHQPHQHQQSPSSLDMSPTKSALTSANDPESHNNNNNNNNSDNDGPQIKRLRSNGSACSLSSSLDGAEPGANGNVNVSSGSGNGNSSMQMPPMGPAASPPGGHNASAFMQHMQTLLRPSLVDFACTYFGRPAHEHGTLYPNAVAAGTLPQSPSPSHLYGPPSILQAAFPALPALGLPHSISAEQTQLLQHSDDSTADELDVGCETSTDQQQEQPQHHHQQQQQQQQSSPPSKRKGFSISAILGGGS
ncbi:PREDICTED: T-box transcription factor TBX2-like [Erythranthe guttata]|uniref:T-box transcription factor TBX2-like n=1 Tax=Erythranthe guttata TaxID=4155 RepID=UPI00064DFEFD|nr:PREDICTED: T-box transcription factor TBX2-like [Erythranthe guttata]|eukprot:XP_012853269.1 PREDICTED: T-box transcription factor TBX2-like [Erythranthe guttata]